MKRIGGRKEEGSNVNMKPPLGLHYVIF